MTSEPETIEQGSFVPRYARVSVLGGAMMVAISALVWFGAVDLHVGELINFGPGAMPRVLASLLFLSGGGLTVYGLLQPDSDAEALSIAFRPPFVLGLAIVLFALFVRGGEFWLISTPQLGLMVVGPVTVFIAGFATPEAKPKELIVMAFGLTAAVLVVFPGLLGVPIPVFPDIIEDAVPPSFGVEAAIRVLYGVYGVIAAALYFFLYRLPEMHRD